MMLKTIILFIFSLQLTLPQGADYEPDHCVELSFLPMPESIKCNLQDKQKHEIDPCRLLFILPENQGDSGHLKQVIRDQMAKTFHCHIVDFYDEVQKSGYTRNKDKGYSYILTIQVQDLELKSAYTIQQEAYKLVLNYREGQMSSQRYVGFVRGLETFFQSIQCQRMKTKKCYMQYLPLQIADKPAFMHRGLMIDSSRHFLPVKLIKQTIDAMMYNKMNVLHWHLTDQDSFPLKLKNHPEIAQYAVYSKKQMYNVRQVKDIVHYAMVRGVRIIPELDTPGHASTWGMSPQNKNVSCIFGRKSFMGPFDITMDETYTLVRQVFQEIFQLFPDKYIHLGGDEVEFRCVKNLTEFKSKQNVTKDSQLKFKYRQKQKQILRQLDPKRVFIYWVREQNELVVEKDDTIQYWGNNFGYVPTAQSEVILSNVHNNYIDRGAGNYRGTPYVNNPFYTWLDLYNQNLVQIKQNNPNAKIVGGQLTLWAEVSNIYTHHTKIWIRSSGAAERFWSLRDLPAKPQFLRRLVRHQKLMNRRGIGTSPATSQQCESHPQFC